MEELWAHPRWGRCCRSLAPPSIRAGLGTHFRNQNKEEVPAWSRLKKRGKQKNPTTVNCGSMSTARVSGISSCCSGTRVSWGRSPDKTESNDSLLQPSVSACAQLRKTWGPSPQKFLLVFTLERPLGKDWWNLTDVNISHVLNDEHFSSEKLAVILQMCLK